MQLALPFTSTLKRQAEAPSIVSLQAPSIESLQAPSIAFVRHPRARRYVIRVEPDGGVRVTIPRGGSKREAHQFADRERPWIERERARLRSKMSERGDQRPPELDAAVRARAKQELPARLQELAAVHRLRVSRITVRNQRWRWGSCSRSGHICLNWRLVEMPPHIRDYVMIHELMHLKRMDHSPRFWKLVAVACPYYEAARKWLRDHGHGVDDRPS